MRLSAVSETFQEGKMDTNKNLIYSARFPSPQELADNCDHQSIPKAPDFKKILERIAKKMSAPPAPDYPTRANKFIRCAIDLSKSWEIDLDIQESPFGLTADIYFYCGIYPDIFTECLCKIMEMSDQMSAWIPPDSVGRFALSFDIFSHKHICQPQQ